MSDTNLVIGGKEFSSRLIVGTGKYASMDVMKRAHEASGAQIVTVALRRVSLPSGESILDHLDTTRYTLLPNTAGCYTADEAIRTCYLAREAGWARWSSSRSSATRARSFRTSWGSSRRRRRSRARGSPSCP